MDSSCKNRNLHSIQPRLTFKRWRRGHHCFYFNQNDKDWRVLGLSNTAAWTPKKNKMTLELSVLWTGGSAGRALTGPLSKPVVYYCKHLRKVLRRCSQLTYCYFLDLLMKVRLVSSEVICLLRQYSETLLTRLTKKQSHALYIL